MTDKKIFSESELDASVLRGKHIGIVGYGSQGRAQALNLRDSGFPPLIGIRPGKSADKARLDGFAPAPVAEIAEKSDVLMLLVPDEVHPEILSNEIIPYAGSGAFIGFAAGFTVHFGLVEVPKTLKAFLVAPKGPGDVLRRRYEEGSAIPALVASAGDDPAVLAVAMAYAKAIGCGRAGVIKTTFREEAIADLFGEQCVLTGGMVELMKAAFQVLVERGYSPEVAYIECIAEVEYMASLFSQVGLTDLGEHISSTAFYGGKTRGGRLIDADVRAKLSGILDEIESGRFFEEFQTYVNSGKRLDTHDVRSEILKRAKTTLDEVSRHDK